MWKVQEVAATNPANPESDMTLDSAREMVTDAASILFGKHRPRTPYRLRAPARTTHGPVIMGTFGSASAEPLEWRKQR